MGGENHKFVGRNGGVGSQEKRRGFGARRETSLAFDVDRGLGRRGLWC